jgi:hypothetical protein
MGFQKDREIGKVLMKVLHEKLDRKLAGRKQELHYARKLVDAR